MKRALGGLAFTLSILTASSEIWAAEGRLLLQQKMALVEKLIGALPQGSPVVSAVFLKYTDEAKSHLEKARVSLASGDHAVAEAEVDKAMRHVSQARKIGTMQASSDERNVYNQTSQSMESLLDAYRKSMEQIDRNDPRRANVQTHFNQTALVMDQARKLAPGQTKAAIAMMLAAQKSLLHGYITVIGSNTVVYTPTFSSPREEYRHELERNKSYQELIPLALAEFKPSLETVRAMNTMTEQNKSKLKTAESQAGLQDYAAATASVRQGTEFLQRALREAGLLMPGMPADGVER